MRFIPHLVIWVPDRISSSDNISDLAVRKRRRIWIYWPVSQSLLMICILQIK